LEAIKTKERIRKLRRILDLTQQDFADRIGMKRNTIANYETGRNDPSTSVISLICREFNVNKNWLETGEGEIFAKPDMFGLDEFIKSRGGTELELEIVKIYFELDPELRKALLSHFKSRLSQLHPAVLVPDTPEELEAMCPPVEESKQDVG
jgi:hypothetical protein